MPTRNINLTVEQNALKLKALRDHLKSGVDSLERGEFVEVDAAGLEHYLETLTNTEIP